VNAVKRSDIRGFIADQLERWKRATVLNRYQSLQAFFNRCIAEGELEASPIVGMKPPQLADETPPVLTDDELRRLLKSCDGRDFVARRDSASSPARHPPVRASAEPVDRPRRRHRTHPTHIPGPACRH
jgi:site-specific recombinase XerC